LGLPELVEFLRRQGVLRADVEQRQLTAAESWLADFDHHLDQVAGNAQRTRSNYLRYARRFLTECFGIEAPNWSVLQPEQVTEFVGVKLLSYRLPAAVNRSLQSAPCCAS